MDGKEESDTKNEKNRKTSSRNSINAPDQSPSPLPTATNSMEFQVIKSPDVNEEISEENIGPIKQTQPIGKVVLNVTDNHTPKSKNQSITFIQDGINGEGVTSLTKSSETKQSISSPSTSNIDTNETVDNSEESTKTKSELITTTDNIERNPEKERNASGNNEAEDQGIGRALLEFLKSQSTDLLGFFSFNENDNECKLDPSSAKSLYKFMRSAEFMKFLTESDNACTRTCIIDDNNSNFETPMSKEEEENHIAYYESEISNPSDPISDPSTKHENVKSTYLSVPKFVDKMEISNYEIIVQSNLGELNSDSEIKEFEEEENFPQDSAAEVSDEGSDIGSEGKIKGRAATNLDMEVTDIKPEIDIKVKTEPPSFDSHLTTETDDEMELEDNEETFPDSEDKVIYGNDVHNVSNGVDADDEDDEIDSIKIKTEPLDFDSDLTNGDEMEVQEEAFPDSEDNVIYGNDVHNVSNGVDSDDFGQSIKEENLRVGSRESDLDFFDENDETSTGIRTAQDENNESNTGTRTDKEANNGCSSNDDSWLRFCNSYGNDIEFDGSRVNMGEGLARLFAKKCCELWNQTNRSHKMKDPCCSRPDTTVNVLKYIGTKEFMEFLIESDNLCDDKNCSESKPTKNSNRKQAQDKSEAEKSKRANNYSASNSQKAGTSVKTSIVNSDKMQSSEPNWAQDALNSISQIGTSTAQIQEAKHKVVSIKDSKRNIAGTSSHRDKRLKSERNIESMASIRMLVNPKSYKYPTLESNQIPRIRIQDQQNNNNNSTSNIFNIRTSSKTKFNVDEDEVGTRNPATSNSNKSN